MSDRKQGSRGRGTNGAAGGDQSLPYIVELRDDQNAGVGRVLACAARISLARAIFKAAEEEYPDRHLILRRGGRILSDTR